MKKSNRYKILLVFLLMLLAVMNQNCSSGFKVAPESSTSSLSTEDCDLPWGGILNDGGQVTAYQAGSVPQNQTCVSQTRICQHGALSGTYTFQNCSVQVPNSCTLPWGGTINDGQSATAYQTGSVPFGQTCSSQTRNCSNGTLSGSYTFQTCTVQPAANCTLDGVTVQHGQSRNFYNSVSVPFGQTCQSVSRTCNNGTLSGDSSYNHANCTVQGAAACNLPWGGTIASGQSVTAYQTASVPNGQTCSSQTRNCNNGTLSGTYQFQTCTVQGGGGGGTLSFQSGPTLQGNPSGNYFSVMLADFTGDGNLDVIETEHEEGGLNNFYWQGNGSGGFTPLNIATYGVDTGNNSSARGALWSMVMDFNGDGKLDWFWDDVSPSSLRINTGGGHFTEYCPNVGTYGPRVRDFYDYNHDGVMDYVDSTGLIIDGKAVLDGVIGNSSTLPASYTLGNAHCDPIAFNIKPWCIGDFNNTDGSQVHHVGKGDLNGDGLMDIAMIYGPSFSDSNEIRIYKNVNNTSMTLMGTLPGAAIRSAYVGYANLIIADFNGDGKNDILVSGIQGSGSNGYSIYLNQGNFSFTRAYDFQDIPADSGGKSWAAVGDYDHDGKIDIALINGKNVHLYKNTTN